MVITCLKCGALLSVKEKPKTPVYNCRHCTYPSMLTNAFTSSMKDYNGLEHLQDKPSKYYSDGVRINDDNSVSIGL